MPRPTILTIDLDALHYNFLAIRARIGPEIAIWPVVKADAYGLGSVPIAQHLQSCGAAGLCVATTAEGVLLREGGVTAPVLILGGIYPGEVATAARYRLTPVVHSFPNLNETATEARWLGTVLDVHLKVDTGMSRLGVPPDAVEQAARAIRESGHLRLAGVLSHLADKARDFSAKGGDQLSRFEGVLATLARVGERPTWVHLSASGGILASHEGEGLFNAVRPGILLYGADPSPDLAGILPIRPVVTFQTEIILLRRIPAGERVSYAGTWVAPRESLIAVLPLGYADGLRRVLSNRGETLVRERRARIVGRVCMDMTMIDVTDVPGVEVGDPVVVFGRQGRAEIALAEIASKADTVPYEILTGIHWRVPRIYVHGGDADGGS